MPLQLNLRPHQLVKRQGMVVTGDASPYVRLSHADSPPVFVQRGHFFMEGGGEINPSELPDWVLPACQKLSKDTRVEVGLDDPPKKK